jgi:uncharacterized membrane-anchored protein
MFEMVINIVCSVLILALIAQYAGILYALFYSFKKYGKDTRRQIKRDYVLLIPLAMWLHLIVENSRVFLNVEYRRNYDDND